MKAKSFVKTISDYRNTFSAANFLSLQPSSYYNLLCNSADMGGG